MIASLLYLVIYIIVVGLVVGLLIYLIDYVKPPEPFHRIGRILIVVVGVIVLILLLVNFVGDVPRGRLSYAF